MSSICRQRPGACCKTGYKADYKTGSALARIAVRVAAATLAVSAPALAQQPATPPGSTPSNSTPTKSAPPRSTASKPAAGAQAAVPPGPGEPTLLAMFGEWGAYIATPNGKKVCFALAKPMTSSTVPPNRPRDPAWMFISTRPAEKVTNEVSVTLGFTAKANADATMELGGATYAMNTQGDGAWVKNPAEEPKLVDILRKGADVTIKARSAKGTASTDVYSLKGLSQALDKIGRECR